VAKNTVLKLLVELGEACARYQDEALRDLTCRRLQVDEVWCFCYSKAKNVPPSKRGERGYGDVWIFSAIDADTKLVPSWLLGSRDGGCATEFMRDLAGRLRNRVQLTMDGLNVYLEAVEDAFGSEIDYTMLQKIYGAVSEGPETRYSPAECIGTKVELASGDPAPEHVSTSYTERQHLTVRMSMRRYTGLTNAFSKKVENLEAAVSLHYMWYNFGRPHLSLRTPKNNRVTPAMAAGIAERPWTVEEVIALLPPPVAKKRGPYRRRGSN
jgi:IS1 family transposase